MTEFRNLCEALEARASSDHGITFLDGSGIVDSWTYGELGRIARRQAGAWRELGVQPGDRVGLLGSTTPGFVAAIFGAWYAGAVAVPLAVPMRLTSPEALVEEVRSRAEKGRLKALAMDPRFDLIEGLRDIVSPTASWDELTERETEVEPVDPDPDDPALIQFTSGSTARPKGVVLTHRCLILNARSGSKQVDFTRDDVAVSWLPLFHDFGLIGMTLWPMLGDFKTYLIPPEVFISSPKVWVQAMSEFRGTVTAAPNFAYGLITRVLRNASEPYDLSSMQIMANGAEPVDAHTLADLAEAGERHGLDPGALLPVYGLAEATLGVAAPRPGQMRPPRWVDSERLAHDGVAVEVEPGTPGARPLVSVGGPIPDVQIEIRDEEGNRLPDGHVGEVCVHSNAIMAGYFEDPEETAKVLQDGWIRTGDLGLIGPDGLVITGRIKDMIIVGGRNLYPEDAERVAASVPGVRRGNAVAFGTLGRAREGLVVVAETRLEGEDAVGLAKQVASEVRRAMQIAADHVVLLRPGSLPKTPSGKLQRRLTRGLYEAGQLIQQAVGSAGRTLTQQPDTSTV
ncbi:MAG TPA: fatty acyl-AMP ligase [Actinomycetota bacterium]|nr:fatty acyl-AMP ligase [Actinomycetota bacterium]